MEKYNIEFKVARDNEAKEAKEFHTVRVTILADAEATAKYMKKAAAVWLQSQIRSNWDSFLKDGVPAEVTLDIPVWNGKRGVVTTEKAVERLKAQASTMTTNAKLKMLLDAGMISEDQFDAMAEVDLDGNLLD